MLFLRVRTVKFLSNKSLYVYKNFKKQGDAIIVIVMELIRVMVEACSLPGP